MSVVSYVDLFVIFFSSSLLLWVSLEAVLRDCAISWVSSDKFLKDFYILFIHLAKRFQFSDIVLFINP